VVTLELLGWVFSGSGLWRIFNADVFSMKLYYQDGAVTIYHGDCREILPELPKVDLVLTDPPYPDYHRETYKQTDIEWLNEYPQHQIIFWSAKVAFPLDYKAIHIWNKMVGVGTGYEMIYERNIEAAGNWHVYTYKSIGSPLCARWVKDVYTGHPSQKPTQLITKLLSETKHNLILDPFMGSGTTLRAAKDLNRKAIGIEIEEKYCEIAARRMQQEVLDFEPQAEQEKE